MSETGSVFIQISEANVHLVRILCDEVFGFQNYIAQISFKTKKMALGRTYLASTNDYIIWYAKNEKLAKFHELFVEKEIGFGSQYTCVEFPNGERRRMTREEKEDPSCLPKGTRVFRTLDMHSSGRTDSCVFDFEFNGEICSPHRGRSWKTNKNGIQTLIKKNRLIKLGDSPEYVLYYDDFPVTALTNIWNDTQGATDKKYVVQTSEKVIQRCMLMTTDPGDLVLDITCGSGTTAYVAEQWGRRWITCDTSRIAITLAKQRLMTATFDYYKLAHPEQGVGSGFIYKTVPHITLGSIANNEPPATETLYDQPEIDKTKIRITGPFTVEALPAPVVKPLDDVNGWDEVSTAKQTEWRDQLLATGILGGGGSRLEFSRVEPLAGTKFLQAEAETKENTPRRAVICFAGETKPMDSRMVSMALDEVENLRPTPKLIIFAAFQFDPEAA